MAAPTASEIIELTGTGLSEALVTALIAQAQLLAAPCIAGVSEELADAAVFWLAAHLVSTSSRSGAMTSYKLGDASESYSVAKVGDGIYGTPYGQTAVGLLPCLASIGKRRACIEVI